MSVGAEYRSIGLFSGGSVGRRYVFLGGFGRRKWACGVHMLAGMSYFYPPPRITPSITVNEPEAQGSLFLPDPKKYTDRSIQKAAMEELCPQGGPQEGHHAVPSKSKAIEGYPDYIQVFCSKCRAYVPVLTYQLLYK